MYQCKRLKMCYVKITNFVVIAMMVIIGGSKQQNELNERDRTEHNLG